MKRIALCALIGIATAGAANAEVLGEMSLASSNLQTATGGGDPQFVDVYHFTVTADEVIGGFNFTAAFDGGFTGNFVNNFNATFLTSPELPVFFGQKIAETFFQSPKQNPTAVQVVDNGSVLQASWAFAGFEIAPDTPFVAAVLSVPTGDAAPVFLGGRATLVVEGANVSTQIVPEPASLALLGLGAVALVGRRRSA